MVAKVAPETEIVFAVTMDCGYDPVQVLLPDTTFQSEFAVRSGAPLQVLFIVHEGPD